MKKYRVFLKLFQYLAPYRLRLMFLIGVALLGVVFEVAKPFPVKLVIDNVLSNHPLPFFLTSFFNFINVSLNKTGLLIFCVASIAVIAVAIFLVSLLVFNSTVGLAQRLVYNLSIDFFSKLQQLSLSFYNKNKVGDLVQRMSGDVFVVYFLVAQIVVPAITSVICLTVMFYIMIKIDLVLSLIAFSVVPALGVALIFFAKPMSETTKEQYNKQGQLAAFVQQSLTSMKIIQAFARENFMYQKFYKHAESFSSAYKTATKVSTVYAQITLLMTSLASAALVGIGAYRGLKGLISVGDLFIFLGYISALYGPVNALITAIGASIVVGARGKRVFDIMDSDEVVQETSNAIHLSSVRGSVEFRNVTFGYVDLGGNPVKVLQQVSFNVAPGQIVAIVGPTGAGKTSLISLLSRFYDPWQGSILIDGNDIRDLQLHSLRENISLVLQEPFLFPMSIADNIAFGNPVASFEEIMAAAKAAQAHDFIMKLPSGYDTELSEAGSSLSGGEKQRIAIARSFLKKAPILIMDEPTSAVDALTEAKIFEAVNEYAKGKTVFLISHRLSTIKHADQILTIKNGCIVEQGTHQSLLEADKVYASLYKHQHIV